MKKKNTGSDSAVLDCSVSNFREACFMFLFLFGVLSLV